MKIRARIFVCFALVILALSPAMNLAYGKLQGKGAAEWWNRSALYNLDFAMPYLARFFYPFGISLDPNQVVIGKNGWLYLGDMYEKEMTSTRHGASQDDMTVIPKIAHATEAWEHYLSLHGVSLFKLMLCPTKATIYPEFLPGWAQPTTESASDKLMAAVEKGLYFDTRPAVKAAKARFSEPLFYKTDTHWNNLAAWVAFHSFTKELERSQNDLRFLSERNVHISKVTDRVSGDLASFLRMTKNLHDNEVVLEIDGIPPIVTEQIDLESGQLIQSTGNPQISPPRRPVLIKSKNALNNKRVLWLRDSFGTAMAPYMAATFSEIVQLHYDAADPTEFARLVDTFKPDYVFVTVIERASRIDWFANPPPL